ncbi:MAG: cyclic nucleotide-binding domain-containing protein, partial [Sphingobacteriales bacterium]
MRPTMYEAFFEYLKRFDTAPLSETEQALIMEAFVPSKLRKRQYLLQEGNPSRHFAFIVKGAMRQYTVDDKGMEHMLRLGVEGWWMGDRESWVLGGPSAYNVDAWEDTDVLLINKDNTLKLIRAVPA